MKNRVYMSRDRISVVIGFDVKNRLHIHVTAILLEFGHFICGLPMVSQERSNSARLDMLD